MKTEHYALIAVVVLVGAVALKKYQEAKAKAATANQWSQVIGLGTKLLGMV